jgi:hypothetical protein
MQKKIENNLAKHWDSIFMHIMSNLTYSHNRTIPCSEPSLCIPRVFANVSEERIIRCWELLLGVEPENGYIDRIDRIRQHDEADGYDYWRVFIHFNEWPDTPSSNEIRHRILQGETCKVVYDEPWWWNVSASRRPKPRHKNGQRPAPYLVRSDPMDISMPSPAPRLPHHQQQHQQQPSPMLLSSLPSLASAEHNFSRQQTDTWIEGVSVTELLAHEMGTRPPADNDDASSDDFRSHSPAPRFRNTSYEPLFPASPIAVAEMAERAAMVEQESCQNPTTNVYEKSLQDRTTWY